MTRIDKEDEVRERAQANQPEGQEQAAPESEVSQPPANDPQAKDAPETSLPDEAPKEPATKEAQPGGWADVEKMKAPAEKVALAKQRRDGLAQQHKQAREERQQQAEQQKASRRMVKEVDPLTGRKRWMPKGVLEQRLKLKQQQNVQENQAREGQQASESQNQPAQEGEPQQAEAESQVQPVGETGQQPAAGGESVDSPPNAPPVTPAERKLSPTTSQASQPSKPESQQKTAAPKYRPPPPTPVRSPPSAAASASPEQPPKQAENAKPALVDQIKGALPTLRTPEAAATSMATGRPVEPRQESQSGSGGGQGSLAPAVTQLAGVMREMSAKLDKIAENTDKMTQTLDAIKDKKGGLL